MEKYLEADVVYENWSDKRGLDILKKLPKSKFYNYYLIFLFNDSFHESDFTIALVRTVKSDSDGLLIANIATRYNHNFAYHLYKGISNKKVSVSRYKPKVYRLLRWNDSTIISYKNWDNRYKILACMESRAAMLFDYSKYGTYHSKSLIRPDFSVEPKTGIHDYF